MLHLQAEHMRLRIFHKCVDAIAGTVQTRGHKRNTLEK